MAQLAVGGEASENPLEASPRFLPLSSQMQLSSSRNQHRGLACHTLQTNAWGPNDASISEQDESINDLLVVLVLGSSSLDHMSGSSSSLLLNTAGALHIIVDDLRLVRPFHRSMSKPEKPLKGVLCLLIADIFHSES
jgi:hypothetical protein